MCVCVCVVGDGGGWLLRHIDYINGIFYPHLPPFPFGIFLMRTPSKFMQEKWAFAILNDSTKKAAKTVTKSFFFH